MINDHPNANVSIKIELLKILSFKRKLPAFNRGKLIINFNNGKVEIEK